MSHGRAPLRHTPSIVAADVGLTLTRCDLWIRGAKVHSTKRGTGRLRALRHERAEDCAGRFDDEYGDSRRSHARGYSSVFEAVSLRPQYHPCAALYLVSGAEFVHSAEPPEEDRAELPGVLDQGRFLAQRDKLRVRLTELAGEPVAVELGMRYGNPSVASALDALFDAGVDHIVALSMYPQDTKACAGTCLEEFDRSLEAALAVRSVAARPTVDKIAYYWNAPGYLDALAQSVREAWSYEPGKKLVVSFHSVPLSYQASGDTYHESTKATALGLASKLGVAPEDLDITYQSRFDSRKWLGPFLNPELRRLAGEGATDVAVVCPIFSVDCIETCVEVDKEAREEFVSAAREAGAETPNFTYVPALGAADSLIDVLANLVMAKTC